MKAIVGDIMKKRIQRKICFACAMSIVLLSGCTSNDVNVKSIELNDFIESVNTKNENALKQTATYDEADYLIDLDCEEFTDEEINQLKTQNYNNVTKDEAKADVDMLMKVLRNSYAGYTYFGGDEAFEKAKNEMYDGIDSYSKNKINPQAFSEIIREPLSFVLDSHFGVGGEQCFDEALTYYESSKMEFRESDKGYVTVIDEENWFLPEEYEKYLKVTIAESGELVYGMFAVATTEGKEALPTNVEFQNINSDKKSIELNWIYSEVGGDQAEKSEFSVENSVAISSLSDMVPSEETYNDFNEFLNNSKKHAEYDYSVLDLRDNGGGSAEIDLLWLYGYTGEYVDINKTQYFFNSKMYIPFYEDYLAVVEDTNSPFIYFDIASNNSDLKLKLNNYYDTSSYSGINKLNGVFDNKIDKMITNPNTLFVLQSNRNYSSGELFMLMLDNVENAVSVGTNTNGCIHGGNTFDIYLPNSGVLVRYSRSIFTGFEKDFEVYGLEPDIYIGDDDAQDAVLRCIDYYTKQDETVTNT